MKHFIVFASLACLCFVVGCKNDQKTSSSSAGGTTAVSLQLNWKPEPEFGGFYAAREIGAFKKQNLDVTITPGGVGTPTVQMVGAGKADFAIVSADEILIARARGNPVVGVLAIYQNCPQGIMVHAAKQMKTIADVFNQPGTLAIQRGLPYSNFLEQKYGFAKLQIVPSPGGDVTIFRDKPDFSQQCFVTSEPIAARKLGADPQTFLIADAGYNPYTAVLATRDDYLKAHPDTVKAMVAACREGWQAYLQDPSAANAEMQKINPGMDAQTFIESAAAQKPLLETDETKSNGLGSMTLDRWKTLAQQLADLKVIDKAPPAEQCFARY